MDPLALLSDDEEDGDGDGGGLAGGEGVGACVGLDGGGPPPSKRSRGADADEGEAEESASVVGTGAVDFEALQSAGYAVGPSLLESSNYLRDAAGQEARKPTAAWAGAEDAEAEATDAAEPADGADGGADGGGCGDLPGVLLAREEAVGPAPEEAPVEVEVKDADDDFEVCTTFGSLPPELRGPLLVAGFAAPTPIQAHAIPLLASGRDLLGVAQTGSGKTLAYLLPCMARILQEPGEVRSGLSWSPPILVLGPTRELVCQIAVEAERFRKVADITAVAVYGGAPRHEQLAALRSRPSIVVATPGRLMDFLLADQACLSVRDVRFLILDEADRMLDDGFEPQIRRLATEASLPSRQTAMFSATFPESMQRLADEFMRAPVQVRIGSNSGGGPPRAGATVEQGVVFCEEREKPRILASLLRNRPRSRCIVFVATKRACHELARSLRGGKAGPGRVEAIHGDRRQEEREAALIAFRDGTARVLVATDVAGRGLDVQGIGLVVNVDPPRSAEDYVHRIGRTGRAGKQGLAISLLTPQDGEAARYISDVMRRSGVPVPPELARRVGPDPVPDNRGASITAVMANT
mmetsp:Transcript_52589/g.170917  ORF Transcript_52589/g.170917 Transcript_52589/m.170917 type:complete len:581 (-) Transcript_52589:19-1761(-)